VSALSPPALPPVPARGPGYRGRLAPSPTGDLHLGGAATFLVAWLAARAAHGSLALRIEDVDTARASERYVARIKEDLLWLGLTWDGPTSFQTERFARYEAVLSDLAERGHTYLCDCSRAEIARVASAPHEGEEGPRYPGTCAPFGMATRAFRRPPAVRFRVPAGTFSFFDERRGELDEDVANVVGDFVLRRGDGVFSYQLAVTVDDYDAGIDHVVRGGDLLSSSARQVALRQAIDPEAPTVSYLHTPLVLMPDGTRLAKRLDSLSVRAHREAGTRAPDLVKSLADIVGFPVEVTPPDADLPTVLRSLRAAFDVSALPLTAVTLQKALLNLPVAAEIR
jgi:glutamyl-tRNA synthetase